ncbi:MAG: type 4a pilus biogenesis protein PilO [Gemmatimonadaceae bacterium]|nr:type 4a pilus biogenesis protein PilO [Gemmatimonadaceae bacterium]NUR32817.1 type 4a pilus biogenesis protein PilO [Gemmatimonadaceae bacterium]NUS97111.1 type 4a pilus biogenesis protein PilO [Gemmatimonadaceae bacterium]
MALFKSERDKVLALLIVVAISAVYAFYQFRWTPVNEQLQTVQDHVDSLDVWNRKAQSETSRNNEKALLQQAARSEQSLQVMRQLVPTGNEVPTLLEQVSTAARRVGLDVGEIQPQPVTPGDQFDTYRYSLKVMGDYHALGEFLTNVGSLTRIIAPVNVKLMLPPNPVAAAKLKRRKDDAIIMAQFDIQTYVAKGAAASAPAEHGAAPAAAAAGAN